MEELSHLNLFVRGIAPHPSGEMYEDILEMSHEDFEFRHDLIQWLFPIMEPSKAQPQSPFLDWSDVNRLQTSIPARHNLMRGQEYMRKFYRMNRPIWLRQYDHNHLRITRIIQSLSLLVNEKTAREFAQVVMGLNAQTGYPVNIESVQYWNKAKFYGADKSAEYKNQR